MDPSVERVIVSSIASDPQARPASVAHVAAALPGGSLLEAALLAGQTPSPELVAAMVDEVRPVALDGLGARGASYCRQHRRAQSRRPVPALARRRAATIARRARRTRARCPDLAGASPSQWPTRFFSGFETDVEYLRDIRSRVSTSCARWNEPSPGFFHFWYRESPQPLESWRFVMRYGNFSCVDPVYSPLDVAGMTRLKLDLAGRLVDLMVVPSPVPEAAAADGTPDWSALLTAGGYYLAAWRLVAPGRTPPFYADARAAWEGTWPLRTEFAGAPRSGGAPRVSGLLRSHLPVVHTCAHVGGAAERDGTRHYRVLRRDRCGSHRCCGRPRRA